MNRTSFPLAKALLSVAAVLSMLAAPAASFADASNLPKPMVRVHKAMAHHRHAAARPVMQTPAAAPAAPTPAAAEVAPPAPAPVVADAAPPATMAPPAPAPAAAKLSVAKKGSGALIGLLAVAGVIGGILLASDNKPVSR